LAVTNFITALKTAIIAFHIGHFGDTLTFGAFGAPFFPS
jgi:hypothetical protein